MSQITALPANCAYGLFDTEFTNSDFDNSAGTIAKYSLTCIQCKPGYRPTYSNAGQASNDGFAVVGCTPIQFCDLTTNNNYLDACGKCATNFAYKYNWTAGGTVTSSIDYSSCVWVGSQR